MSKTLAVLVACAVAAAAVDTNPGSSCESGIVFSGLGKGLDGDYMAGPNGYANGAHELCFGSDNSACDNIYEASAEDKALAKGKWAIASESVNPTPHPHAERRLVAVCVENCPGEFGPGDFGRQWPASTASRSMVWRLLASNGTWSTVAANVDGHCCKPKPNPCSTCSDDETCSDLVGPRVWIFFPQWNSCPPNAGSADHPQSDFQKTCCSEVKMADSPLTIPGCKCIHPGPEDLGCDHSVGDVSVVV